MLSLHCFCTGFGCTDGEGEGCVPPLAWLPVSQGRKGSRAFIPLLGSYGSGAEKSVLWQHLRKFKMEVLVILNFILLQLQQFPENIFT